MDLYKYRNYEDYRQSQINGNKSKINCSWVNKSSIYMLADYIFKHSKPSFGLCHGTRRGMEQEYFKLAFQDLGASTKVIGTEISPTATQFPNTIEWDFHNTKPEWIGSVDFIYSNAFDHSYKPAECLRGWMECLSPKGLCILEWSNCHNGSSKMDPFGATIEEYRDMINSDYFLKEEIPFPSKRETRFLIIENVAEKAG